MATQTQCLHCWLWFPTTEFIAHDCGSKEPKPTDPAPMLLFVGFMTGVVVGVVMSFVMLSLAVR